jgi:hypothetical protein
MESMQGLKCPSCAKPSVAVDARATWKHSTDATCHQCGEQLVASTAASRRWLNVVWTIAFPTATALALLVGSFVPLLLNGIPALLSIWMRRNADRFIRLTKRSETLAYKLGVLVAHSVNKEKKK